MSAGEGTGQAEVRDARGDDVRAVQRVAQTTWDHTYRDSIPERVREEFVSRAYSADSLRRRMESNVFLAALQDGNIVGFADFRPLSQTEVELAAIYVLPGMQGRGPVVASWQPASPALQPGHGSSCALNRKTRPPYASTRPAGSGGPESLRRSSSDTSFTTSRWSSILDRRRLVDGFPNARIDAFCNS